MTRHQDQQQDRSTNRHSTINTYIGIYVAAMTTLAAVLLTFALNKIDSMNTRTIETETTVQAHEKHFERIDGQIDALMSARAKTPPSARSIATQPSVQLD